MLESIKLSFINNPLYAIASVLSIFFFVISVQFDKKKNILLIQSFASLTYIVAYFALGSVASSGTATEVIEFIKDIVFYKYEDKNLKIPFILLVVFVGSLILANIFTVKGILGLLPLLITIAYFVSSYFKNPFYIRIVMFICAFLWAIYNYYVGAHIIIIGNILEIISAFVSMIRYKKTS